MENKNNIVLNNMPLTKPQKEIMSEFYKVIKTKISLNKKERDLIWEKCKKQSDDLDFKRIRDTCPSLYDQIKKSYSNGNNIQSSVFSECVYAQTLANMFRLPIFINSTNNKNYIPHKINKLLNSYNLVPRYIYSSKDKSQMLIQAGGNNSVDSALITIVDLNIFRIEFKEPAAKASEPDLPKYNENGKLTINDTFLNKYPQFNRMLNEKKNLNFFKSIGSNINNFSNKSVNIAISNNYNNKKYADVICTEDNEGYLTMLPANQAHLWAKIQGEIRPAGRNSYKVWTPLKLRSYLREMDSIFDGEDVTLNINKLSPRKERGGNSKISGYKINPLFFIRIKNCDIRGEKISFKINDVRQLKPTITAKMFFKETKYDEIKKYYKL